MSSSEHDGSPPTIEPQDTTDSKSLDCFELTGKKVPKWTERNFRRLTNLLDRMFFWRKKRLPGNDESVGKKLADLPGKGLDLVAAKADIVTAEVKLKQAQAETEFVKQELIRQQAAMARVEAQHKKLDVLSRQMEILEQINEITQGRTDCRIEWHEDNPRVIIANLPTPASGADSPRELPIEDLQISKRFLEPLIEEGIETAEQLSKLNREELIEINGLGAKAVEQIEKQLAAVGFKLPD